MLIINKMSSVGICMMEIERRNLAAYHCMHRTQLNMFSSKAGTLENKPPAVTLGGTGSAPSLGSTKEPTLLAQVRVSWSRNSRHGREVPILQLVDQAQTQGYDLTHPTSTPSMICQNL